MSDAIVEIGALHAAYLSLQFPRRPFRRRVCALQELSLRVERGAIVGIVGPNGSGKTTLLRVILGLVRPTQGELRVFGERAGKPRARRRTGYAAEEPEFFGRLTGRGWLGFSGRLFGLGGGSLRARVEDAVEKLGLGEVADHRISTYSKGMRRRLALAQALLHRPELLLLDEPFEGLDPLGGRDLRALLEGLAAAGAGILVTSHRLGEIETLCREITVLHEGRVLLQGETAAILTQQDRWQLLVGDLSEADLRRLTQLVESACGRVLSCERPRRSLEALFVDLLAARGERASR
ncbi:MAG: ABC transporter ATP-binding protein [Planctomycetota bacterium]